MRFQIGASLIPPFALLYIASRAGWIPIDRKVWLATMPIALLVFAAASMVLKSAATYQPGTHGLSEVLYNFASASNNNGSAFAGLSGNTMFYNLTGAIAMLVGRFWMIIPMMAMVDTVSPHK